MTFRDIMNLQLLYLNTIKMQENFKGHSTKEKYINDRRKL